MEILSSLYHEALYRPLLNALLLLYTVLPVKDLGIAIILFTVLVRIAFLPLSIRAAQSQKQLAEIQPKVKEVQERHKHDKERQMRETMALYREHKVNPMGGCVPLLIQMPILIALYQVFLDGLAPDKLQQLYPFIAAPEYFSTQFLHFLDLTKPNPILAVVAGASQFFLSKLMSTQTKAMSGGQGGEFAKALSWQMTYFFPIFTVVLAWSFPAGITLYWIVTTVFSLGQQVWINGKMKAQPAK